MAGEMARELSRAGFEVGVHRTGAASELRSVVRKLVEQRAQVVGVMGGDGTLHDALNALLNDDGTLLESAHTAFASVPAGTGGDLAARTLKIPTGARAIAEHLAKAEPADFDLGRIEYLNADGAASQKLFANIASCGMSGRVDVLVKNGPAWLTGAPAYLLASGRALLGWRHCRVRVKVDGNTLYEGPMLTTAVANGRSFGGGMIVAPDADPRDGMLDVVVLGNLSLAQMARMSAAIYKGEHTAQRSIHVGRGKVVEIDTLEPSVLLDVDGEAPGRIPARFSILPAAVKVLSAA